MNWADPYAGRQGRWYKGNLHTHTSPASACGAISPADSLAQYVKLGYDFLAISDHMGLTADRDKGLVMMPGVEWNSPAGEHAGVYSLDAEIVRGVIGIADQAALLSHLKGKDALVILNHPNWQLVPHYRREQLLARQDYDGIEIYNGVIERLDGAAISTDKWDYLLVKGRRVLGFASDDSHCLDDIGLAAIMVRSSARDAASILAAIRRGNFYCTTGVEITDIRREGNVIHVQSANGQEVQAISRGGVRVARVSGPSMSHTLPDGPGYVRFAVYGPGAAMAWTQPFFVE